MRKLAEQNGLASTALINLISMADSGYKIEAYTTWTQEFSREGLLMAEMVVSALDTLWDYSKGYVDKRSLGMLVDNGLWDIAQVGGIGVELVLDNNRLPRGLVLFPYDQVEWKSDGKGGRYPSQRPATGEPVDLNYPTIFISESVKSVDRKYAVPFIASGAQRLNTYESFIQDMWRVIRRAGEPRIVVKLDYEKIVASAPGEVQGDQVKLGTYLDQVRSDIETLLQGLDPEDALVVYDLAEVDKIETSGEKRDFKELLSELSNQAASAMKSNASMLGMRSGGSQNVASTEAMLATMVAQRIQKPLAEAFSRALTLAVRLMGVDAYIKFKFQPINLRPEMELAAHRAMFQNMTLELLSLGRITDAEAQTMMNLGSLPQGAEELSGTGFYKAKPMDTAPASGTNARNASITPEGPSSSGGADNEQRA